MSFVRAVHSTPALAGAFRPGLQALKPADAGHISCEAPRILAGSVDIDTTLSGVLPHEPRWDYAIGVQRNRNADTVIWVEVHPASSTREVNRVLEKLSWLKAWAADVAPNLMRLTREYVWVATGHVAFTGNSPQRRQLAAKGIRFVGNRYTIQPG
jgi:hypothetical protein